MTDLFLFFIVKTLLTLTIETLFVRLGHQLHLLPLAQQ